MTASHSATRKMTGAQIPALATTAASPKAIYTCSAATWNAAHAAADRLSPATASSTSAPENHHSNDKRRHMGTIKEDIATSSDWISPALQSPASLTLLRSQPLWMMSL